MNHITLLGRLTKDPELKTTNSGKSVATFALAVDRKFKQDGQPSCDFINCVAWGKPGETISQYCTKGRQLAVEGRIQIRNYDGKNGKVYVTEVIVESFDFVGDKSSASGKPVQAKTQDSADTLGDDFFLMAEGDELPF